MGIFLRLAAISLIPVTVSVALYLLEKRTKFGKLPYVTRQIIIGILLGGASVMGTELGVPIDGATINVRDAAPLCAGLIFGGPAGIIAGVIGGVERWIAASWGAGMYSRVACSVSTVIAGFYAAGMRKFLFDNRCPTWGFGTAAGVVIEVFHMLVLFLTHLNDAQKAYSIVKICTLPMIFANSLGVMLAIIVIQRLSRPAKNRKTHHRNISTVVQSNLLLCVVVMYFITTGFVFILQTQNAYNDFEQLMETSIGGIADSIEAASRDDLLKAANKVAAAVGKSGRVHLKAMAGTYEVDEISIVDENGIITASSEQDNLGWNFHNDAARSQFLVLLDGTTAEYVQPDILSGGGNKFAGAALENGFVQVGISSADIQSNIASDIANLTNYLHAGESGYFIITDAELNIMSSMMGNVGKTLDVSGIELNKNAVPAGRFKATVYGEDSFCLCRQVGDYYILGVLSEKDAMLDRDNEAYINSFNQVIAYAVLFGMIYILIKRLVVNNIRQVNDSLGKIINGDLSVQVDVRDCDEFASLSDDINSTVATLQKYIDEAAARIDKELEFARNIQTSALPAGLPPQYKVPQFRIYATMDAAKEVGGDFYDYYMLDSDNLAFLIADVSGKGIPAAMFMMRAKTMIKNFVEMGVPLDVAFDHANKELCEGNDADMFVTAWMGILNIRTGHVRFVNAGHNPPLVYRHGKGYEYVRSKVGFVLAAMDMVKYKLQELDLEPGDKLFLYTDGITEATSIDTELYGEERLQTYLCAHPDLSCKETLFGVTDDVNKFVNGAEQFDDMTMLALAFNGDPE